MTRWRHTALCTLVSLLSSCYHLAYHQANHAADRGDFATAADKDLEALDNAPDSAEARALWDRIWPPYCRAMTSACESAAADSDPTTLLPLLNTFETILSRSRKANVPTPDAPTAQLTEWRRQGGAKAYSLGEKAETAQENRQASAWFRLAQGFLPGYRDSAERFERNRKAAFVVVLVGEFSARGDDILGGYGLGNQTHALVLQGLQAAQGDFLGIRDDERAPVWVQHRYRLSGSASVRTDEPTDDEERGSQKGLIPVPNGPPKEETVWYTRHHVVREVAVTVNLKLQREGDLQVFWQHGFTNTARDERRWLVVDRGPKAALSGHLQEEADNPTTPPDWMALQDEAGVDACEMAVEAAKAVIVDLR
jgi:hypothetical protein